MLLGLSHHFELWLARHQHIVRYLAIIHWNGSGHCLAFRGIMLLLLHDNVWALPKARFGIVAASYVTQVHGGKKRCSDMAART